jgi:hypothetical protein
MTAAPYDRQVRVHLHADHRNGKLHRDIPGVLANHPDLEGRSTENQSRTGGTPCHKQACQKDGHTLARLALGA